MKTQYSVLLFGLLAMGVAANAETYDVVNDFPNNATTVPSAINGVWSYGTEATLGGTFTLYNNSTLDFFGDGNATGYFNGAPPPDVPTVLKDIAGGPTTEATSVVMNPNFLMMHPGVGGAYSVIQFTAPQAGTYDLNFLFQGLDTGVNQVPPVGTTTDVHVLLNNDAVAVDQIWNSVINGYGATSGTETSLTLNSGDTVQFAVGLTGSPGDTTYFNDSTGLEATLVTPEPGTLALFGAGLAGLGLLRRRKAVR